LCSNKERRSVFAATSHHEVVPFRFVLPIGRCDTADEGVMGCRIGGQDGLCQIPSAMVRALQGNES